MHVFYTARIYTRVYQRTHSSLMPVYTRFYSRNNPNTRVFMATTRYEKPVYPVRIWKQMDNHMRTAVES